MSHALEQTIEETLAEIKKAQTTGFLETTGAYSYDLTGVTHLIPVVTPFREKVSRVKPKNGTPFAIWRAFMDLTRSQPRATPGFDFAANEVLFKEQDFQAKYQPVGLAGLVTQDAYDLAQGLMDPYADTTMQVLSQTLIAEEKLLIGAQSFALAQPGTVTATPSTTGGTVAASTTIKVSVAARTASGYYYGGNSQGRASGSVTTTGATLDRLLDRRGEGRRRLRLVLLLGQRRDELVLHHHHGGVGDDHPDDRRQPGRPVHAGAAGRQPDRADAERGGGQRLGAGQRVRRPARVADRRLQQLRPVRHLRHQQRQRRCLDRRRRRGAVAVRRVGHADRDRVRAAVGVGEVLADRGHAQRRRAQTIANLVLGGSAATTFLNTDASGRINTTAGGRVGQIVNTPAGGVTVPLEVNPYLPPGTIVFRTDHVPFPNAEVGNTLEVRTLRDMTQFEYATNRVAATAGGGPRKEFEIRSVEAFVNRAPVAMGVLTNHS
jgi:hypothetical protein